MRGRRRVLRSAGGSGSVCPTPAPVVLPELIAGFDPFVDGGGGRARGAGRGVDGPHQRLALQPRPAAEKLREILAPSGASRQRQRQTPM